MGSLFGLDPASCFYISHALILFSTAFVIAQLLNFAGEHFSGHKVHETHRINTGLQGGGGSKKRKGRPDLLLICGPTNSGKTALFYHLLTKEVRTTVTSIDINETSSQMEVKIPSTGERKALNVVDVPGHYHFKERLNLALEEAKAIILVVDAKEKDKFGEAAEILYEILNNLTVLSSRVPVAIACNKQDLQFAKKAATLEAELEKEIEELRKVRKATINDDDKEKQRYLETLKKKFTFADVAGRVDIRFIECSVKTEDLTEVYKFVAASF